MKQIVLGNNFEDVQKIELAAERLIEKGYGVELFWDEIEGENEYEGFLYSYVPSINVEEHWRPHIYVYMYHSCNDAGGYILEISTLDADDGICLLPVTNCKYENAENYIRLFEFSSQIFLRFLQDKDWQYHVMGTRGLDHQLMYVFQMGYM